MQFKKLLDRNEIYNIIQMDQEGLSCFKIAEIYETTPQEIDYRLNYELITMLREAEQRAKKYHSILDLVEQIAPKESNQYKEAFNDMIKAYDIELHALEALGLEAEEA